MKSLSRFALVGVVMALAGPAAAQLATNSSAPIRIDSDDLKTDNNACVATYTGNVEALQDNARMRTDLLKVFAQPNGKAGAKPGEGGGSCGSLIRIEAHGSVYYVTPQQRVKGDDAIYEAGNDTLTVTGDVVAVQDKNVIKGTRMVINNQTGMGHMETDVKGRNKPGRVSTVIYPQGDRAKTGAAPAAKPAAQPR
jgi:lipopolysaccharide export system protein LptA